ncbi:hypothetical protein Lal_00039350 [Lupinus albus]|nr:hypothetical protein Lal_00039350 [Lupinus albus]
MTRGNTGHLHPINPEIDRTYHRLVRQSRNLPFHSVPDSVSDSDSISNSIPVSVHSVQYTDFVHSENSVYSENMAQPPTPPGPLKIMGIWGILGVSRLSERLSIFSQDFLGFSPGRDMDRLGEGKRCGHWRILA